MTTGQKLSAPGYEADEKDLVPDGDKVYERWMVEKRGIPIEYIDALRARFGVLAINYLWSSDFCDPNDILSFPRRFDYSSIAYFLDIGTNGRDVSRMPAYFKHCDVVDVIRAKIPIDFVASYSNSPNLSGEDIVSRFMWLRTPMAIGSAISRAAASVRDGLSGVFKKI